MKVTVHSGTPTKETLKALYDVCNEIFKGKNVFYLPGEVKKFEQDKKYKFL